MSKVLEINALENTVIVREATAEEIAQRAKDAADYAKNKIAEDKAAADKTAARQAVLNRLGLTEEEAQLIIGGSN